MHSHILLIETIAVLSHADASSYVGHVISGTRYFDINRESGQIIVQAPLDREQIDQYSIVVKVGFSWELSYQTFICMLYVKQSEIQLSRPMIC